MADGRVVERHDDEQATLALLRQLRESGYTLRKLAADLNQRGLRTRRNTCWTHQFIFELLVRHPTEIM